MVAREDLHGDKILAAFFVAKAGHAANPDALRAALEAALPAYMVPTHFVQLERLPLTANGKIDRKALPPSRSTPVPRPRPTNSARRIRDGPRGSLGEALGFKRISRQDNFFRLGGHSLAALKIAFRTQQEFKVDFPLQVFVQHPVLCEQAKRLEELLLEQADDGTLESFLEEMHRTESIQPITGEDREFGRRTDGSSKETS